MERGDGRRQGDVGLVDEGGRESGYSVQGRGYLCLELNSWVVLVVGRRLGGKNGFVVRVTFF